MPKPVPPSSPKRVAAAGRGKTSAASSKAASSKAAPSTAVAAPASDGSSFSKAGPPGVDGKKPAARIGVVFYPPVGKPSSRKLPAKKAGVLMMGGEGSVDDAFRFMHKQLTGGDGGGNIVVLRATGKRAFDEEIYGLAPKDAPFDSVQEILVAPDATDAEIAAAAKVVAKADGVFMAGGNQANYVRWAGTPMERALRAVAANDGVLGGRSAGLHVLGAVVFDAKQMQPGRSHVTKDAVADPFDAQISFSKDLLGLAPLGGARVLTDSHFGERDRMGRLATWLSRLDAEGTPCLGVGVDESTCVVVDEQGKGALVGTGAAYFVRVVDVERLKPGEPLRATIEIVRLGKPGDTYDFATGETTGSRKRVVVDGALDPIYSSDPYAP